MSHLRVGHVKHIFGRLTFTIVSLVVLTVSSLLHSSTVLAQYPFAPVEEQFQVQRLRLSTIPRDESTIITNYYPVLEKGDIDGDGKQDIVTLLTNSPTSEFQAILHWSRNRGMASANNANTHYAYIHIAGAVYDDEPRFTRLQGSELAVGDIDNDGDADIITGECERLVYLPNTGAPDRPFIDNIQIITPRFDRIATEADIELGDIDGDGDLDLVMACQGETIRYLRNNGTTTPFGTNPDPIAIAASAPHDDVRNLALGDIDGDSDIDLVAGISSGPHRVYINNGRTNPFAGLPAGGRAIPDSEIDVHNKIELVDLNQDGRLDVLSGLSFYLNDGTDSPFSTSMPRGRISDNTRAPCDFLSADINGDGAPDVLSTSCDPRSGYAGPLYELEPLLLHLNSKKTIPFSISTEAIPTGGAPGWILDSRLLAVDIDGDNDEDIAWAYNAGSVDLRYSEQSILLNQGFVDVPMPVLTAVHSDTVVEGDGELNVQLTLSTASKWPVRVSVGTNHHPSPSYYHAVPNVDYSSTSRIFEFSPGETVKTLSIAIIDDDVVEAPYEDFWLNIYGLDGANLSQRTNSRKISIVDNDGTKLPSISLIQRTVYENPSWGEENEISALLSHPWHEDVEFNVSTLSTNTPPEYLPGYLPRYLAATQGEDYYGFAKRFTIPAGQTRVRIPFSVIDDSIAEPRYEYTWLQIYGINPATVLPDKRISRVAITDDELPSISVQDMVVNESQKRATVIIRAKSDNANRNSSVQVETLNGTATQGNDFYGKYERVHLENNDGKGLIGKFEIQLVDDDLVEPPEQFRVTLYHPRQAILGKRTATITVISDD